MRSLHAFMEDVSTARGSDDQHTYGQTHRAFAAALSSFLQGFTQDIADIEKNVKTKGKLEDFVVVVCAIVLVFFSHSFMFTALGW